MSADGEIEIQVAAEGVDDAAGEMSGDALAGGGAGEGEDMGSVASNTGRMTAMLGSILALLSFLGPVLDVLGAISSVLEAFVAPLAAMMMRLLTPVLLELINVLPVWYEIVDQFGKIVDTFGVLATLPHLLPFMLLAAFRALDWDKTISSEIQQLRNQAATAWDQLVAGVMNLPTLLWENLQRLPGMIGAEVAARIPTGGSVTAGVQRSIGLGGGDDGGDGGGGVPSVGINFEGGLETFIERAERSTGVEFP